MEKDSRPLFTLTCDEFRELMRGLSNQKETTNTVVDNGYVYGLSGLASILGASVTTAQRVKNSGKLDSAITQVGRKICIDVAEVRRILKQ